MERINVRDLIVALLASVLLAGCSATKEPQNSAGMDQRTSSNAFHSYYLPPSDPVIPDNPQDKSFHEWSRALLEGRSNAPGQFFD